MKIDEELFERLVAVVIQAADYSLDYETKDPPEAPQELLMEVARVCNSHGMSITAKHALTLAQLKQEVGG